MSMPWSLTSSGRRSERSNDLNEILEWLHCEYQEADLGNQADPIDELVYISLTRQTHHWNALASWERVVEAGGARRLHELPEEEVVEILKDAGLSRQKARWIKRSFELIQARFGSLTLDVMLSWPNDEVERFLMSLPGISLKSARCVMLFSMGRNVLPVDTHVRRVSERVGLVDRGLSEKRIHRELDSIIEPEHRYGYHVNAIWHGRQICLALDPRCEVCPLGHLCGFGQEVLFPNE